MGGHTIKEAILDDHKELGEYYGAYKSATTPADRKKWANQYVWELARHTVAKELVLYPVFEHHLGEHGQEVTKRERSEHQKQKEMQYKLERMGTEEVGYAEAFDKLQTHSVEHIVEEEATLKQLSEKLTPEEDGKLLHELGHTKKFLPTRAHPGTHQPPPFETL